MSSDRERIRCSDARSVAVSINKRTNERRKKNSDNKAYSAPEHGIM